VVFPLVIFTGSFHGFTGFFMIAFLMVILLYWGVGHGLGRRRFAKTIDTFD